MVDVTATTKWIYDAVRHNTSKTLPGGQTISYKYDPDGNLLTRGDQSGTETRAYNALDQLTSLTDPNGKAVTIQYDKMGRVTQLAYPNGVTESNTFDSLGNMARTTARNSAGVLTSFTYSYTNPNGPATGQQFQATDGAGNATSFQYDAVNRLTSAAQKNPAGGQIASYQYSYDADGNLSSDTINGSSTSFTYNAADELSQGSYRQCHRVDRGRHRRELLGGGHRLHRWPRGWSLFAWWASVQPFGAALNVRFAVGGSWNWWRGWYSWSWTWGWSAWPNSWCTGPWYWDNCGW